MSTKDLVSDEPWAMVEPRLPPNPSGPGPGRPRVPDRTAFAGTVYVLKSGIPWRMRPRKEFGCSGVTCWRRLRDWREAGVFERLHRALLDRLSKAGLIDWTGGASTRPACPRERAREDRPCPVDRG